MPIIEKLLLDGGIENYEYLNKSRREVDGIDDLEEWSALKVSTWFCDTLRLLRYVLECPRHCRVHCCRAAGSVSYSSRRIAYWQHQHHSHES